MSFSKFSEILPFLICPFPKTNKHKIKDGALPSVVGGLVSVPVIAVPTSVGYGVSLGGVSAMLTMLNSCSPGVGVVNVDNGFGAAALAYKCIYTSTS